jgi:hypothetical protein
VHLSRAVAIVGRDAAGNEGVVAVERYGGYEVFHVILHINAEVDKKGERGRAQSP